MGKKPDLQRQAAEFAHNQLTDLLNGTVTKGIRISAAQTEDGPAIVGLGVGKKNFVPQPIPITVSASPPRCFIYVRASLYQEDEGYLAVADSTFALYVDDSLKDSAQVLRYDYERDKEGHTDAHMQVYGQSQTLDALLQKAGRVHHPELDHLHFPVGGKRYRPSLEDLIEFLIDEELAEAHPGAAEVIERHRSEFYKHQLRAAMRADPETARQMCTELPEPD